MKELDKYRSDLSERYTDVKNSYGDFNGKRIIDIGCHTGYFSICALLDGASEVVGFDIDEGFLEIAKDIANSRKVNLTTTNSLDGFGNFDICLYLDLHYHKDINYFEWIKKESKTLYASCSGHGSVNNKRFEKDLFDFFGNCQFVSTSDHAGRHIFKVICNE